MLAMIESEPALKFDEPWERLAESALSISRCGNSREALAMLQSGIDAARRAGTRRGEVVAMNCAALVHSMRGDRWAALAGGIDAFSFAHNENDRLGMAAAMTKLAGSLRLLTPVESKIGMLRAALKIANEAAHGPLQQRAHNLRGIVLGDIGHFVEAAMHFGAAYQYAIVVPSQFGNWRVLANMANLSRKRAKVARARHATPRRKVNSISPQA